MMEKFADDCHYFAVYDGHGSSGKEVFVILYFRLVRLLMIISRLIWKKMSKKYRCCNQIKQENSF